MKHRAIEQAIRILCRHHQITPDFGGDLVRLYLAGARIFEGSRAACRAYLLQKQ